MRVQVRAPLETWNGKNTIVDINCFSIDATASESRPSRLPVAVNDPLVQILGQAAVNAPTFKSSMTRSLRILSLGILFRFKLDLLLIS
jgi:hypothetical protein